MGAEAANTTRAPILPFVLVGAAGLILCMDETTSDAMLRVYGGLLKQDMLEHCPDGHERSWLEMQLERLVGQQKKLEDGLAACPEDNEVKRNAYEHLISDTQARLAVHKTALITVLMGGTLLSGTLKKNFKEEKER